MKEKLIEIQKEILRKLNDSPVNTSLLTGSCGELLLLLEEKEIDLEDAFDQLFAVVDTCESHNFSTGLAGLGWFLQYAISIQFLDEEEIADFLLQLDEVIYNSAMLYLEQNNHDFLSGAIGNTVYLLERTENNSAVKGYLEGIARRVIEMSKRNDKGVFWTENEYYTQAGQNAAEIVNLSLSHGQAGKMVFFSKLYAKDILAEESKKIAREAAWFLLQSKNPKGSLSIFPSTIQENNTDLYSRLSWCYGDLGISGALWLVGDLLNDTIFREEAFQIALETTKRKSEKETGVKDAAFCHGSSGISHVYYRMYLNTGENKFKDAANYWLTKTIEMSSAKNGAIGFQKWDVLSEEYVVNYSLLEGMSGIGLVLQAQIENNKNPTWDRAFFLS